MTFKLPSRADHVGSFLRPQSVIEARDAFAAGSIDAAALREVEDKAIAELTAAVEIFDRKQDGDIFQVLSMLRMAGGGQSIRR